MRSSLNSPLASFALASWALAAVTLAAPGLLHAEEPDGGDAIAQTETKTEDERRREQREEEKKDETIGEGKPSDQLPPVRSDDDERPTPPALSKPQVGVVKQAGIGGEVAYGRARVLELGGSALFTAADDFTQVTVAPTIGWFVIDNLQLSAILSFSHVSAGDADANFVTLLAEPSFHLPFAEYLFGFVGLGAGLTYIEGPGAGFALAPRVGLNILVGRSGIVTPQLTLQYSTHDSVATNAGTLLAVSTTFGGGVGYTVMW
ncbi:hypothetical protein L6R52_07890 [Myxococcota bacterium]|nr:hypothetical protein [Myxococcota bacterium]